MEDIGYAIKFGPEIALTGNASERKSYQEIILQNRLYTALELLNPYLPKEAIEDALRKVYKIESPDLILNNRAFHKMIIEGVEVNYPYEGRQKGDLVKLIDFENFNKNQFLAVNQYTVIEKKNQVLYNRRPDIVLFINGIPLIVIELKNPSDESTTIRHAFNQLQTYKKEIPSLFRTNELLIISDGFEAKVGSLSANWERFMPWRTIEGETLVESNILQLEVLIRGILDPARLLDYIRFFITFEDNGEDIIKKSAAYHQFHAVNKAIEETLRATGKNGDRKIGVVWHTQGSGKSITMLFYTGKLIQMLNNPTILLLTDRNDLDEQLSDTFMYSTDLLRQIPKQAEGREDVMKLLNTSGGGIIFSTIQKFLPIIKCSKCNGKGKIKNSICEKCNGKKYITLEEYPCLSDRKNIIVIADEAHRSQYSFRKSVSDEGLIKEGFAAHIRKALPNASFIGFTGTPIELVDRNTIQVFGNYISIYDIYQAIIDKTTVPIYYESRLAKLKLNEKLLPEIDEKFEEITEDEEETTKERLKSKWSRVAELAGDPDRIEEIAYDIIEHFKNRTDVIEGKALIVCMSREICVDLYNQIIKIHPGWHSEDDKKGEIKVIMSGSASDKEKMQPHIRPKKRREEIKKRLVNPDDPLKIVIVRDMWLTGFDAPCLHTMYVDKPMKDHNLMQAIARVNRVFKDKPGGLIVDYIGIGFFLKQALFNYSNQQSREQTGIPIETVIELMKTYHEIVSDMFFGFDYTDFFKGSALQRLSLLPAAMEHILQLKGGDGKKRYLDNLTALNKAFSLATPNEEALAIRDDLAFFQAVRAGFVKATTPSSERKRDIDHAIRQLISEAVISDEVIDIFSAAGLEKPEISILSEKFLKEVEGLQYKNLAIELLNKLLSDQIKSRAKTNLVESRAFSELLKRSIIKYQNRTIEATKILEELLDLAREMRDAQTRGEDLGLNDNEIAFYDALAKNKSAVEILGDETLKKIAKELVLEVRKSATIDFTVKANVQAKMRVTIKRLLKKYKYPPDQQPEAIKLIMEQAQLFGEEWASIEA